MVRKYLENKITVSKGILFFTVIPVFILANATSLLLHASSMRIGVTVGMMFIFTIYLITSKKDSFTVNRKYLILMSYFMIVVLFQYVISSIIYGLTDFVRFILSYFFIFSVFIVSIMLTKIINKTKDIYLNKTVFIAFWILFSVGIISSYLISNHLVYRKFMILFSEPSHFSLVYLPILLYVCYVQYINENNFKVIIYLLVSFAFTMMIQNSTMLTGLLMIVFLLYSNKLIYLLTFLFIFIIGIFLFYSDGINYFLSRITLSADSDNASVLVFMSGWERAYLAVIDSYGFGLGFQQMGIVGPNGAIMDKYSELGLGFLNFNDGGTLGAKLVAELGLFGLSILFVYLVAIYSISRQIIHKKINDYKSIFYYSIFIMTSITFFVRGAGYFTPTTFMFAASIYWIYTQKARYVK